MNPLRALIFVAASILPSALTAHEFPGAHGVDPDQSVVYFTVLYTLQMPLPLVLVTAGLLLGLNRTVDITHAWLSLMLGILVGVLAYLVFAIYVRPVVPLLLLTILFALWSASGLRVPWPIAILLTTITGFFVGMYFTPVPVPWLVPNHAIIGAMIGASIGILGSYLIVVLVTDRWNFAWIGIAFRVLAAWIGAIATLVAALSFR